MVSKVVSPCNSSAKLPSLGYFRLSPKSQFDNFQRHNNGHVAACGTHGKCLAMSLRFDHGLFCVPDQSVNHYDTGAPTSRSP